MADQLGWKPSEFWAASLAEFTVSIASDIARRNARSAKATNEDALDAFFSQVA